MSTRRTNRRPPALSSEIVQGEPMPAGEREIIPVVRVTTYARRRALVGAQRLTGQGGGFVHLKPIAIIARGPDGERRIPIPDKTVQILGGLLLVAFIVPVILMLAVQLMRKR